MITIQNLVGERRPIAPWKVFFFDAFFCRVPELSSGFEGIDKKKADRCGNLERQKSAGSELKLLGAQRIWT